MSEVKVVPVAADWLDGLMKRYENAIQREAELAAEVKLLRGRELMTREMIAAELGGKVKAKTVDYYLTKGLNPIRLGKMVCVCTRAEFERWYATDPINFHKK